MNIYYTFLFSFSVVNFGWFDSYFIWYFILIFFSIVSTLKNQNKWFTSTWSVAEIEKVLPFLSLYFLGAFHSMPQSPVSLCDARLVWPVLLYLSKREAWRKNKLSHCAVFIPQIKTDASVKVSLEPMDLLPSLFSSNIILIINL